MKVSPLLFASLVCLFGVAGWFPIVVVAESPFVIISPSASSVIFPGELVSIAWEGGDPFWLVDVSLIDVTDNVVVAEVAKKIPNKNQVSVNLPTNLVGLCTHTYQFYIQDINQTQWIYGPEFTVSCNKLPTITSFTATPKTGNPPLIVNFNVLAKDSDGSISEYQWDFDGKNGSDSTTITGNTTYTYNNLGTFKAKMTVVDNLGGSISKSILIKIAYSPDLVGEVETYNFSNSSNTIHIDFNVRNNGKVASPPFNVGFYLSNDGKTLLPEFKKLEVSQGLGIGENTLLSVDNTFIDSIYGKYVFIIIDPEKQVAEIDETNNGTKIVIQTVATK